MPESNRLVDDEIGEPYPVLVTVDESHIAHPPPAPRPRIEWARFSTYVEQHLTSQPVNNAADVEQLASHFCDITQEALKTATIDTVSTPNRRPTPHYILEMIAKKRALRKRWQQTRCPTLKTQVNSMSAKIAKALQTEASDTWLQTIESASDDWTSVHRLCRQVANKPQPIRPLLASDGTPRYRAEDRAEIFADNLEQRFKPNPSNDSQHAEDIQKLLDEYFLRPIPPDEDPIVFTPGQVLRMIRKTKLRKAPGPDGIPNEALRHLPPRAIATLTRLYNGILRTGHYPSIWKLGRVIMLPKPNKNVLNPGSYRPITLLATISKVFEKLLLQHLTPHVTPRDEQFGFRAEHSTTLQLTRVLHHMTTAYNKGEKTVGVFLDMEGAFDRVWHPGLIYKLSTSTTPRRVVKTVANFLTNRLFQVAVGDSVSTVRTIEAGVPQGSCLSPVLYARYTDDIPLESGSHLALYADDAAYYASSMSTKQAVKVVQRTLDALPDWLARWRLSINVAKTQAIVISRTALPPRLSLQAQDVAWTSPVKYLGVQIDRRLTMKDQVQAAVNSTRAARALLRPVLDSVLPLKVKLGVYKTYIRPRLTYAAPAWYALTNERRRKQLEAQQSISLRVITKAPRYVRNSTIQKGLQMESLDATIRRLTRRLFQRVGESTLPHIQELAPYHARPPDRVRHPGGPKNPKNLPVREVHRMYKGQDQGSALRSTCALSFSTRLTPRRRSFRVKTIVSLDGLIIEKPHKRGTIGQCHNCQHYGHSARHCYAKPRCVKCLEAHATKDCTRAPDAVKESVACVLCGKTGHPANWRGCPNAPAAARRAPRDGHGYAGATFRRQYAPIAPWAPQAQPYPAAPWAPQAPQAAPWASQPPPFNANNEFGFETLPSFKPGALSPQADPSGCLPPNPADWRKQPKGPPLPANPPRRNDRTTRPQVAPAPPTVAASAPRPPKPASKRDLTAADADAIRTFMAVVDEIENLDEVIDAGNAMKSAKDKNIECSIIRVAMTGHQPINIASVYLSPNKTLLRSDLESLFALSHSTILAGDFNSKSRTFSSAFNSANGNILEGLMDRLDFDVAHTVEPTHYPNVVEHTPSVIDIALLKKHHPQ
ncbi:unnamed protein product, partial [Trichogramma brassicae]